MIKDQICIADIQAFCRLGVYEAERKLGQSVYVSLALEIDLSKAMESNKLKDTQSYVEVSVMVREIAQKKEYHLIEHLAGEILKAIFDKFDKVQGIHIEIKKPIINDTAFSGNTSIKLYRSR